MLDLRPVSAPTDGEVERVCATVGRGTRLLKRRGLLEGEDAAPDVLGSLLGMIPPDWTGMGRLGTGAPGVAFYAGFVG